MKSSGYLLVIPLLLFASCNRNLGERTELEGTLDKGVQRQYDKNGILFKETPVANGKAHGLAKEFYSNGKIRWEQPTDSGLLHGLVVEYFETGEKYMELPYVKGKREGWLRKFYKNGKLAMEQLYQNSEIQPGLKEYDKNGTLLPSAKLMLKEINHLNQNNTFEIELTVSPVEDASYFLRVENGGKLTFLNLPTRNGSGIYVLKVFKGRFLIDNLFFKAEYKTTMNNRCVLDTLYNVKIIR